LVDFDQKVFDKIVADYTSFIHQLNIADITCIPLSALDGDNVVEKSIRTPWYKGLSLLEYLETVPIDHDRNYNDFRFPVQYVMRPNLNFRGFSGKVASGVVHQGDEIMVLPSKKTSKIKEIVTYDGNLKQAFPPLSITLTLEDEIDISRGDMLVHPDNLPLMGRCFKAMFVWMDEQPMVPSKSFYLKQTTQMTRAHIDAVEYKVNVNTMERIPVTPNDSTPMKLNEIGSVRITTARELFFDLYTKNKQTGAFILIDPITNNTSAVGMITEKIEDTRKEKEEDKVFILNLPELDIKPDNYDAVERAVKHLVNEGLDIKLIK